MGLWVLRGLRRGLKEGRCSVCREVKNAIHILLKCPETKRWRYQFLSAEWLKKLTKKWHAGK
jgi:hypothetical protein